MNELHVCEVFQSIDGEGIRTGAPAVFIRFAGCNLRCDYCDTAYALSASQSDSKYTDAKSVAEAIFQYCNSPQNMIYNLTFTGGEPLLYGDAILEILGELHKLSISGDASTYTHLFSVNIETNGSIDPNPFLEKYLKFESVTPSMHDMFFTFDLKTASAGEAAQKACIHEDRLVSIISPLMQMQRSAKKLHVATRQQDVMKAVVGSVEDLDYVREQYLKMGDLNTYYSWFISPVFCKINPQVIVAYILDHPELYNWRVQLQLHKIIWPPDMRGV